MDQITLLPQRLGYTSEQVNGQMKERTARASHKEGEPNCETTSARHCKSKVHEGNTK